MFPKYLINVTVHTCTVHQNKTKHQIQPLLTTLDLCIPFKELTKTCSQILFIYFQSHYAVGLWTNIIPKGTMKTPFEPGLPTLPSRKNIKLHLMDSNSGQPSKLITYCTCQDPICGNKPAKQIKVQPSLNALFRRILFPNSNYKKTCMKFYFIF